MKKDEKSNGFSSMQESALDHVANLGDGWERVALVCPSCKKGTLNLRIHFEEGEETSADMIVAETKACPECHIRIESMLGEQ